MRILHISPFYSGGGAERCARDLFERQKALGHDTQMWTAFRRETDPDGVRSLRLPGERYLQPLDYALFYVDWRHVGSMWHLDRLRRRDFDVVHVHNVHGGWISLGALARLCRRLPVVWTLHDEWGPTGGIVCDLSRVLPLAEARRLSAEAPMLMPYYETGGVRRLRRFLATHMPRPAAIICPSQHTARLVVREGRFAGVPSHHIPYGLPLLEEPAIDSERAAARTRLNVPQDRPVVLLIAQYLDVPHKGMDLAIRALNAIAPEQRPHLLLLGRGVDALKPKLPGFQVTSGYAATQEELATAYRAADLMLIPSRSEGFGYVIVEAFACRTPVVGFRIGSLPELIGDDERGLLADAFDVEQMRAAVERLLADHALRRRMGDRAREWVARECAMDAILGRIDGLYRNVTATFAP
ncbi:MAG: hypothetical protein JWM53_3508 [bacterium]|nr:hypothetical protein [bacterium]